jgi:hypothetical protein
MEVNMAKISLKEAMVDFRELFLMRLYKKNFKNFDDIREIIGSTIYELSLEYLDRVDDVATREMSLEIDRLNVLVDSLRDNLNRRENEEHNSR